MHDIPPSAESLGFRAPLHALITGRPDERDLSITDYDIEEVEVIEEGERAIVTSRIKWMRLPSVSEQSGTVTSEFIYREGKWLLEKQSGGPFDGELP